VKRELDVTLKYRIYIRLLVPTHKDKHLHYQILTYSATVKKPQGSRCGGMHDAQPGSKEPSAYAPYRVTYKSFTAQMSWHEHLDKRGKCTGCSRIRNIKRCWKRSHLVSLFHRRRLDNGERFQELSLAQLFMVNYFVIQVEEAEHRSSWLHLGRNQQTLIYIPQ
jgi:hypothetical protein